MIESRKTDNDPIVARSIIDTKDMITMATKTLTINEVSALINVAPRTIRKVLRANFESTPGRGGRYSINEKDIPALVEMVNGYTAKTATVLEFPKS